MQRTGFVRIILLAVAVLAAMVKAEHAFRLVLNHGETADYDQECFPNEVELLHTTIRAANRRYLGQHVESSVCQNECREWKRGYCFIFFCLANDNNVDQLVEIEMKHCVSEFVAVNNAINSVLPDLSPSCQHVLAGGRDVTCYDLTWSR